MNQKKQYKCGSPDYHRAILGHNIKLFCRKYNHDLDFGDTGIELNKHYVCECGKEWSELWYYHKTGVFKNG